MTTQAVNFNSVAHKDVIIKLCKRNNFYENEVATYIYIDDFNKMKSYIIKIHGNQSDEVCCNVFAAMQKRHTFTLNGLFMTIKVDEKTRVIGFVIYRMHEDGVYELIFILIDKKYQSQKYGSFLLNAYHSIIGHKTSIVSLELENIKRFDFYKKFGYLLTGELSRTGDFIITRKTI